jgi:hypothetical protein
VNFAVHGPQRRDERCGALQLRETRQSSISQRRAASRRHQRLARLDRRERTAVREVSVLLPPISEPVLFRRSFVLQRSLRTLAHSSGLKEIVNQRSCA